MKSSKLITVFHDRYPFVGPLMWILSVQYFLAQVVVAAFWQDQYSFLKNTISDLGNTACRVYDGRLICSPEHVLMNISFIILGAFMALGSVLIYQEFRESAGSVIGFTLMFLAGLGTILVGVFPENTVRYAHEVGAVFALLVSSLAIITLGISLKVPRSIKIYSVISGLVSIAALILFFTHKYLGIGIGGMERIGGYPTTLWLIIFGIYISKNRYAKNKLPKIN